MAEVLRYPYEAITDKTDYLQVTIITHPRSGEDGVGFNSNLSGSNTSNSTSAAAVQNIAASSLKTTQLAPDGIILLPMPSNIEDSNSVSYDGDTLNGLSKAGINAVQSLIKSDYTKGGDVGSFIKSIGTKAYSAGVQAVKDLGSDNLRDLALTAVAAEAVNIFGANVSIDQILARSSGKILNPNMELLFKNVTLRTFKFSFKMVARDQNESVQIKAIIRSFKKNMAAKTVKESNLFLDTPNIFELQYKKGNLAHPFLHKFKQCVLSDMSVNYTGENVYATYNDGTPITIILNLTFKEIVPIYSKDYDEQEESGLSMVYSTGTENNQGPQTKGVGY